MQYNCRILNKINSSKKKGNGTSTFVKIFFNKGGISEGVSIHFFYLYFTLLLPNIPDSIQSL